MILTVFLSDNKQVNKPSCTVSRVQNLLSTELIYLSVTPVRLFFTSLCLLSDVLTLVAHPVQK
jgi:hypothetical protein